MPWEDPELSVDEDGLILQVLQGIGERIEGWEPNEGAPEVALAEEIGVVAAATNALATEALRLALAGIGETVFKLAARTAAHATLPQVRLELFDSASGSDAPATAARDVNVPAGFTIVIDDVAFQTTEDFAEAGVVFTKVGSYYMTSRDVAMTAVAPGTVGNVTVEMPATVVTTARYVAYVTVLQDAAGGVDEESLTDYLTRLTDYLSTLRPGGVLAVDLATLARTVSGVHRALAIDLYDPGEVGPQERTATVIAIDAAGNPVDGSDAIELAAVLEAAREVNFNIILAEPNYTGVDVIVEVEAAAGFDHGELETRLYAAIAQLISPASWGSTSDDPRAWTERKVLRALDVAVVLGQVPGVLSIEEIRINGSTTSITIPGPGALPAALNATDGDPSTIIVEVS